MKETHMKSSNMLIAAVVAASIALGGCATNRASPVTPQVALPGRFHTDIASPTAGRAVPVSSAAWWKAFDDPALTALVDRALADNPNIAIASARIAAARAELAGTRAAGRPQVQAVTGSQRVQQSENGLFGNAIRSGAFPERYSQHSTGMDALWELDLFGAVRAQRHSAQAGLEAVQADEDALRLSLPAEITRVYVEHLVVARQLASLQRSVQAAGQRIALFTERLQQGDASEQQVSEVRQDMAWLSAQLPLLQASRDSLRHAMAALLGTGEYQSLPEDSPMLRAAPTLLDAAIVAGMPSDLLRRRPDIRGAESEFRRAFADHQYAIADQYPRFAISVSSAQESLKVGDLLKAASVAWNVAGQVVAPMYDGGRRKAATAQRQAQLDAAIAAYRGIVTDALSDVEQSLLARQATSQSLATLSAGLADAQHQLDVEQARYSAGDSALTQLLQARLSYEGSLNDELRARADALLGYVRLQNALGGPP
jgi:NodT family efflux transporter outer membrane factor (OMF) lipoprotein